MFGIEKYTKGHVLTSNGNYDASILDTDTDGVWLIPYDDTEVMFVAWDDISGFAKDVFGDERLRTDMQKFYYDGDYNNE